MNFKMLAGKLSAGVLGTAMVLGCGLGMAVTAFAANGVQNPAPNGYTYTTTDSQGTGAWLHCEY